VNATLVAAGREQGRADQNPEETLVRFPLWNASRLHDLQGRDSEDASEQKEENLDSSSRDALPSSEET